MIFKIHYFSFNAGLSGVLVLITVFLRKYSDASSTEVGTLLMVLPFIAVFTKPFFCALADRHRRYRLYFILALVFTLLGFGSYTFVPFFPSFIEQHGRAAWYLLVVATVVGYIAYGVVWSLGDAYAANVSHRTGESFGLIRLWGTIGWGVAGALVGAVSPYLRLPEMVLGFIIFIITHVFEIILLAWWPNGSDFEMGDALPSHGLEPQADKPAAPICEKPQTELGAGVVGGGGGQATSLVLQLKGGQVSIASKLRPSDEVAEKVANNSNSNDSSNNSSNNSNNKCCCYLQASDADMAPMAYNGQSAAQAELERRRIAALQTTIFKMVARKHKSLIKYLIVFVALGTVYNIHWSYFFLHLDQLAAEGKGGDFSTLVGMCLVAQAVGETFCFAIAPWVVAKLGRDGAISLNAITYAIRYFGNGFGIPLVSPYVAVLTESLQGINYGIFYYLITDTALHYALLVEDVIPELRERKLLNDQSDLGAVRTSLRATMQGVFSGAFDGLGFGLGSLIAGLVLERHSYEQLWCYTAWTATLIFGLHGAYELINRLARRRRRRLGHGGA